MTQKKDQKSSSTSEAELLMEISRLQQQLVKTKDVLKWLMYESTVAINAATPFVLRYMKPESVQYWDKEFADPIKLDEYGSTALLCFRDATAANIYAAVELFGDSPSVPGTEYEIQRDNLSNLSKKMNEIFRELHTDSSGELTGKAYRNYHNNTILGKPGEHIEKAIRIPRQEKSSRLTKIAKMFSNNKENS